MSFSDNSNTLNLYDRCYCSIFQKTTSSSYAVNIMGEANPFVVKGTENIQVYQANVDGQPSPRKRKFCRHCSSYDFVIDACYSNLVDSFSALFDIPPQPPMLQHIMLRSKAAWLESSVGHDDDKFERYPELSIEERQEANVLGDGI